MTSPADKRSYLYNCQKANEISLETWNAYFNHPTTRNWLYSQIWRWEDGDAIVTSTRDDTYMGCESDHCYVAIRHENKVEVVKAESLNDAMVKIGMDPSTFEIKVFE